MSKLPPLGWLALAISCLLLVILASQYAWTTTWPIGGDAASYIRQTMTILDLESPGKSFTTLISSRYPGALILLAATRALPLEWPSRYVFLMVVGHIVTGLTIAWFLWRQRGWPVAALGMAVWALTTTSVNHHFESGTLAQLWSLPFALLALERGLARAAIAAFILAITSTLIHPLTGILIALTGLGVLGTWYPWQKEFSRLEKRTYFLTLIATALFASAFVAMTWLKPVFWKALTLSEDPFVIGELVRSYFGPYILLMPAGYFLLFRDSQRDPLQRAFLLTWPAVLILTLGSHWFGDTVSPDRFQTYLIVTTVLVSSVALPTITMSISRSHVWATFFIFILLLHGAAAAWSNNNSVYRYYENPDRYARLHPGEEAALRWLKDNSPTDSFIASTENNRHSEWIPILSDRQWEPISESHSLFHASTTLTSEISQPYTHIIFFRHREKPPAHLRTAPARVVYETADAIIIELP